MDDWYNCPDIAALIYKMSTVENNIDEKVDFRDVSIKTPMGINCKHYSRDTCLMHFPCCPKDHFYPCHKCHNEMMEDETLWKNKADNENQPCTDENDVDKDDSEINNKNDSNKQMDSVDTMEILALASSSESIKHHSSVDRKSVDSVKCTKCHVEQELLQHCISCKKKFASYFCNKCKLLANNKELDPYHCDKCGVCRAYKSEYYHCDGCNLCMDKKLLNKHKCIADSQSDECAVCLQEVFSGCLVFPCGHKVHEDCALNLVMRGNSINCPVCRQPFLDLNSKKPGLFKRIWQKFFNYRGST
ncbi:E3 ubiquitin-protein ligase SRFP1-like [Nematostella vectensis]|uniref:E3 ubiquitin-protein ligase SRFP1-like n=1 Tax=Nematostella vectensis TaxID=45351 RepID=UPI00138FEC65|nr:E3 ubiquitin-protein ligase SRFP1-like [Nematostella vectensis]